MNDTEEQTIIQNINNLSIKDDTIKDDTINNDTIDDKTIDNKTIEIDKELDEINTEICEYISKIKHSNERIKKIINKHIDVKKLKFITDNFNIVLNDINLMNKEIINITENIVLPKNTQNNQTLITNNNNINIDTNTNTNKSKKNKTLYWGIEINNFNNEEINEFIKDKTHLILLKKIHSTLLFVGKKDNDDEKIFYEYEGQNCMMLISEFGYSNDALSIKVDSIVLSNSKNVPTFATQQHITFALRESVKAVDSVKTLLGEGTIIKLNNPVIIHGIVKRFLY